MMSAASLEKKTVGERILKSFTCFSRSQVNLIRGPAWPSFKHLFYLQARHASQRRKKQAVQGKTEWQMFLKKFSKTMRDGRDNKYSGWRVPDGRVGV